MKISRKYVPWSTDVLNKREGKLNRSDFAVLDEIDLQRG